VPRGKWGHYGPPIDRHRGFPLRRKRASLQSRLSRHPALALACALGALVASRPAAARRYTLAELVARVDGGYAGVRAAREGVRAADAQLSQANRLWWPTGQLTFALTGSPEVRCVDPRTGHPWNDPNAYKDQFDPNNPNAPFVQGDKNRALGNCTRTDVNPSLLDSNIGRVLPVHGVAFNLGVNLTQPLYTFGKIEAAQAGAHAGIDVARAQVDKDRTEVTFNITRAYWGLKWARTASATLSDGVTRLKEWIKKINDDIDKGKSTYTENDLVRLKLALDTAELTALDIDKARQLSLVGLRTLTEDPDADIDDEELDVVELSEQPLDWYEDAARIHRPDARMLAAATVATHAAWRYQRATLLPDLGVLFSFNYSYAQSVDDPYNGFLNHPNVLGAYLALGIRYDLAVPEHLAQLRKARADELVLVERRRQALGGIAVEIENAWLEARAARKRSDLLAHSEKVARGWYNAVDQNLQVGVAESRDLVDAARNYFELRLRHLQSIMDVNMAIAGLKQAAGMLVQ
jgi:outer membrane protein TolC